MLDVLIAYGELAERVVSTASVWVPLLLGLVGLVWGVMPPGALRRDNRPDTSGHDADIWADIDAEESA